MTKFITSYKPIALSSFPWLSSPVTLDYIDTKQMKSRTVSVLLAGPLVGLTHGPSALCSLRKQGVWDDRWLFQTWSFVFDSCFSFSDKHDKFRLLNSKIYCTRKVKIETVKLKYIRINKMEGMTSLSGFVF